MKLRSLILGALALGIAGPAMAITQSWGWTPNSGVGSYNDNGGAINWIESEFNESTKRLLWKVNFAAAPTASSATDGFTLALNNGPNPKGHAGELALFYYDATRTNDERLTVYGYNARNDQTSFKDGDGSQAGNQTPDRIKSSRVSTDWILGLTDQVEIDGSRTLGFEIDATDIISHNPLYPGPNGPAEWTGAQYDDKIGVWMHQVSGLSTQYYNDPNSSRYGYLKKWEREREGWLDLTDDDTIPTRPVPEPSTVALLGLGFAAAIATRLRKRQK